MNGQNHPPKSNSRGPKRQLLGNHAGQVAPAWRNNRNNPPSPQMPSQQGTDQGDRVFLSSLPTDVQETEIQDLFQKTVGPVKECFLIYNSQGKSKGMAIVTFQRPGDAFNARAKYNGKIVDGRHALKIQLITDVVPPTLNTPSTPSLLKRIGGATRPLVMNGALEKNQLPAPPLPHPLPALAIVPAVMPLMPKIYRQKKGPKRIKKRQHPVSRDQLDREIEAYRAAS